MKIEFKRIFVADSAKGSMDYIDTQKKYELAKTILFFSVSLAIFIMGWLSTKTTANYLTIVAVLGCLPASKWAVNTIMFWRFHSLNNDDAKQIKEASEELNGLFDMVFTSYEENFQVNHLVVTDSVLCGYSAKENFNETAFIKHITEILRTDGFKNITVKIFTDKDKYMERLYSLKQSEQSCEKVSEIITVLKNVTL